MPPQREVRLDAEESFAESDEDGDVEESVGVEVMKLEVVEVQKPPEEGMHRHPKATLVEGGERHRLVFLGGRHERILWDPPPRYLLRR